jgi:hypothetical protein
MALTALILTKLAVAQRQYLENICIDIHQNGSIHVERMDGN